MSPRVAFGVAALVCIALLGYGFYLQYVEDLEPCPLCLVQRGFYFAFGGVSTIAAIHGPTAWGTRAYALLCGLFAVGGLATAGRQVWLQHLPADRVPQCGPDLYFMLENLPLAGTIQRLFTGTGQCAVVDWQFLGLSIAEWSAIWFALLLIGALWLAIRGSARSAPRRESVLPA